MNEESTSAPPAKPASDKWWAGGLLGLLVLLVYLPSFRGGFVWDDALLIEQNPLVKGELNLRSIWFSTDFPLSNVALWLEWLAFGKNAMGYRSCVRQVLQIGDHDGHEVNRGGAERRASSSLRRRSNIMRLSQGLVSSV